MGWTGCTAVNGNACTVRWALPAGAAPFIPTREWTKLEVLPWGTRRE
jgi:hypothetical protein